MKSTWERTGDEKRGTRAEPDKGKGLVRWALGEPVLVLGLGEGLRLLVKGQPCAWQWDSWRMMVQHTAAAEGDFSRYSQEPNQRLPGYRPGSWKALIVSHLQVMCLGKLRECGTR